MHHLADPLGYLMAHIGHLHTSLPLHHHLNDDLQLQFALLASSASIELVSSSARVTSAKFHKVPDRQRPGPIDRTPETPGSGKKKLMRVLLIGLFYNAGGDPLNTSHPRTQILISFILQISREISMLLASG